MGRGGNLDCAEADAFERQAELAYAAMYQARRPKDCYEDSIQALNQAIDAARADGLADQVARLAARRDHVTAVYRDQFRWV